MRERKPLPMDDVDWANKANAVYEYMLKLDGAFPGDEDAPIEDRIANFERAVEDCIEAFQEYYDQNELRHRERLLELRAMPYAEYLQTPEWRCQRDEHVARIGFHCQLCGAKQGKESLHVHHSTYERRGHESPEDLIALCPDCHARFHDKLARRP